MRPFRQIGTLNDSSPPPGGAGLRASGRALRRLPGHLPLTGLRPPTAFRVLAGAALALLLAGAAPALGSEIEIERSPADTRDYRAVALGNGLEALVVSDPDADRAAAALDVNVGSANDPETRPGFAHFLEHMLFLGTEKYPEAQEYDRFLTEHGGFGNARTGFAHTTYFFDVDAAHLEGALDRFAQFFINPRFDREHLAGERRIVHFRVRVAPAAATTCEASRRGSRPSIRAIPSPGSTPGTRRPSPSAPAASSGPSSSTSTRTPTPPT